MKKIYLVTIFVLFFITGCGSVVPETISPEIMLGKTPTVEISSQTADPTIALPATQTVQPRIAPTVASTEPTYTSTPYPTLSTQGTYLAYLGVSPTNENILNWVDVNGVGRFMLKLPSDARIGQLKTALSPDGQWLAFHSGSADQPTVAGEWEFTLKLMHLPDGKIIPIANVLSPQHSVNLDESSRNWKNDYPFYNQADLANIRSDVESLFIMGISAISWSPDSRYLAFAGEIEGTTSDLYQYDTQTTAIERLTNENEYLSGEIHWSPDGRQIVYQSSFEPPIVEWKHSLHVIQTDGSSHKVFEQYMNLYGWVGTHALRVSQAKNGVGEYELTDINVESGVANVWWQDGFSAYTETGGNNRLAICGLLIRDDAPIYGLYLHSRSLTPLLLQPLEYCTQLLYRGNQQHEFVLNDSEKGVFGVTQMGEIHSISPISSALSISPDLRWLLVKNRAIELYDETDTFIRELTSIHTDDVFWRPDSQGIFFTSGRKLYYLAIPDGEPALVDSNIWVSQWADANFHWILK
jgi:WD40 repeat protein